MNTLPSRWRNRLRHRSGHRFFMDLLPDFTDEEKLSFGELFEECLDPRANISETEDKYSISLELPGMKEDDVEVHIMGDRLVVSGERKHETEQKKKHFHRREFQYGSFQRSFALPQGIRKDPETVSATFHKGVLEIRLAKVEPQSVEKIPVQSSSGEEEDPHK